MIFFFNPFSGGQSEVIFNYENKCNDPLWLGASPSIGDYNPQQDLRNFINILMNGKVAFWIGPSRGVHRLVWVGFVPNLKPTLSHRVEGWMTRHRLRTTSGWVESVSNGQLLGLSKSKWVSTTRSSLNLRRICWFFVRSVWQPRDRNKNHHLKPRFKRKLPSHHGI